MRVWSAERVFVKGNFERDWALMVDESGVVQAVGPRRQLVSKSSQVLHYPQSVILPAFVNPHHHGFHTIFKGVADQMTSIQELNRKLVWPLSQVIDEELLDAIYRIAFAEQALSGVASVGEFHYLHNGAFKDEEKPDFAQMIIDIALQVGLRINLIYVFFDQGDPDETSAFIEPLDVSLERFALLVEKYKDNPRVRILPGVHGLVHTSPEAIMAAHELAKTHGLPLHIRLAEREEELTEAQTQFGTTPLRALEKMDLLGPDLVVIHGNRLDSEEFAMMKRRGVNAVVCPSASLAKGDELNQVYDLLEHQIPFALGSDSECMNNSFSPPDEIKWAEFSQRSQQGALNILNRQANINTLWDLVSSVPARILGNDDGILMPGSSADFVIVDIDGPTFRPRWNFATEAFLNQLIFGWGPQVRMTHLVVRGRIAAHQGRVVDGKLADSYRKIDQWSHAFMRSLGNRNTRPMPPKDDDEPGT